MKSLPLNLPSYIAPSNRVETRRAGAAARHVHTSSIARFVMDSTIADRYQADALRSSIGRTDNTARLATSAMSALRSRAPCHSSANSSSASRARTGVGAAEPIAIRTSPAARLEHDRHGDDRDGERTSAAPP